MQRQRGGQSGNQNATTHGIYSATRPKSEQELAEIADLAIQSRNIAMLRKLLCAPAYADKPEKRRAIRQLIRTLITSEILATAPDATRSTHGVSVPKPRIAIGH